MDSEVEHKRRRRSPNYPLEFKRKLAQQACESGVSVAQLALQHGLNSNMVFKWRRQLRAGLLDQVGLLPVTLAPALPVQTSGNDQCCGGVIEIRLGAAVVRVEGRADPATLTAVLQGLRG